MKGCELGEVTVTPLPISLSIEAIFKQEKQLTWSHRPKGRNKLNQTAANHHKCLQLGG